MLWGLPSSSPSLGKYLLKSKHECKSLALKKIADELAKAMYRNSVKAPNLVSLETGCMRCTTARCN